MVDFHKIVREERRAKLERRLAAICRCTDEIDAIKHYPPVAIFNALGQLDWLGELHNLLYDENYDFTPAVHKLSSRASLRLRDANGTFGSLLGEPLCVVSNAAPSSAGDITYETLKTLMATTLRAIQPPAHNPLDCPFCIRFRGNKKFNWPAPEPL